MQDFRNVGIDPDYDHLYDPQQRPDPPETFVPEFGQDFGDAWIGKGDAPC